MSTTSRRRRLGRGAARRTSSPACSASCSPRSSSRSSSATSSTCRSAGLRAVRHHLAVAGAAGRRRSWLKESEEIRFDIIYGASGRGARRVIGIVVAVAAVVLFGISLPATVELRRLHEGREHRVPQDPLRLAVLDLRRLRGGRRSSATCGRSVSAAARRGAGSGRRHQGELRAMNLTSPFALALIAIVGAEPARAADRPTR